MVSIELKHIRLIKYAIFIFFVFILTFSVNIYYSTAYWGYSGNCEDSHGISYLTLPYDPEAIINLDGNSSESFWNDPANKNGKIIVPLASRIGPSGKPDILIYMNATFVMNKDYLYILCEWEDKTTESDDFFVDGLFFCWNINVTNFSSDFFGEMSTEHLGGGRVDSWGWYYLPSYAPRSSIPNDDQCFADNGWLSGSEKRDGNFAFTYKKDQSYTVEFSRKLITNDNRDVQFNKNQTYLFNMAIMNNGFDEDHAISWTYGLNVTLPAPEKEAELIINGYFPLNFCILSFIAIVVISIYSIKKLNPKRREF